jgi:hypothetical protein
MLHSFLRSQQSLARILGGDVSSTRLKRNADAIAGAFEDEHDSAPLQMLQEIRDGLVELYEALIPLTEPRP